MHNITQLAKQQIGLRLPKYLIDELESLSKEFSINKTDIITEAIRAYIQEQKAQLYYDRFDDGCKELKRVLNGTKKEPLHSLDALIDELEDTNA